MCPSHPSVLVTGGNGFPKKALLFILCLVGEGRRGLDKGLGFCRLQQMCQGI